MMNKVWILGLIAALMVACSSKETEEHGQDHEPGTEQSHDAGANRSLETTPSQVDVSVSGMSSHDDDDDDNDDDDNKHRLLKAPHGGLLEDEDGMLWELVGGKSVKLYILDSNLKTTSVQGISGDIVVQSKQGKSTAPFKVTGEFLSANLAFDPEQNTALVSLLIKGKKQSERFSKY